MATDSHAHKSLAAEPALISPQATLIQAEIERSRRRFYVGVVASWAVLLLLLGFVFSGIDTFIGPFRIKTIHLDPEFIAQWAPFIAQGATQTIYISFISIIFATLLALFAALARLSRISPVYALSTFYVSLIRGTPLFLQVMFFFLALPQMGIKLPGLWAGVLALGLNYGAYMSEIFRAGILSVGKGQREAALALGMTYSKMMRRVVLPQALRFAIPPTGNEFIAMLKDSALVSATGFVHEIMWRATKVGRANFRNLEALLIAAVFYWFMTLLFTAVQTWLERRMGRGDH
ncbi:MAG: amino acid ABC transporter permease [Anaerolineales bacterium]